MSGVLTTYDGAAGRVARDMLRASWPGTRVLKSALAAGLAWWVAEWLGDPAPMSEAAIEHCGQAFLDGSTDAFVVAETSLGIALASHAAVVSTIRLAAEPWDMDRATVLAETKHILDELLSALA